MAVWTCPAYQTVSGGTDPGASGAPAAVSFSRAFTCFLLVCFLNDSFNIQTAPATV